MTREKTLVGEFLDLSAVLTGYDAVDLQGTGLVEQYWETLDHVVGDATRGGLIDAWRRAEKGKAPIETAVRQEIMSDPVLGPVARNLVKLWYLGQWQGGNQEDWFIPSAAAYTEGLVWDAIGAHPQGAKQEGFGTWQFKPGSRP